MKLIIYGLLIIVAAFVVNSKLPEIGYELGYAEIEQEVILKNQQNIKVKCVLYTWDFVDQIRLDNKFQTCINDYEEKGYTLLEDDFVW